MKKAVLIAVLATAMVLPAFSQVRLDIGVDVPMTVGSISGSGVETEGEAGDFLRSHILPFPEASLGYQFNAGPVKIVPGLRAYTFILLTAAWPNVAAELQLGPVFLEAQLGGLLFLVFGLANAVEFGQVFVPDLSVWYGIGKERRFRLGGGVIGMYAPEVTEEAMLIIPYLGGKVSLTF